MQDTSKQASPGDPGTEAVVLLQLLRDDHPEPWTLAGLDDALYDVDEKAIEEAVESLAAVGVVVLDGKTIEASPSAWRIEALGFICI